MYTKKSNRITSNEITSFDTFSTQSEARASVLHWQSALNSVYMLRHAQVKQGCNAVC